MAIAGTLITLLTARTDQFERGMGRARRELSQTARLARTVRGQLLGVVTGIGAGFTLQAITGELAQFAQQMAGVRAVTGATQADFEALSQTARRLGSTTQFTATQAASAMQFLGQAGFDTQEILTAIPDTLALAAAGALDLATAADIASNVLSAFNLHVSETGRVADVLANAATSSNTTVEQLGEAMKFAAPTAASLGITLEETAAFLSLLSDRGIQAGAAGANFRRVMASLLDPTLEARDLIKGLQEIFPELDLSLTSGINPSLGDLARVFRNLQRPLLDTRVAVALFGRQGFNAATIVSQLVEELEELTEKYGEVGIAQAQQLIRQDTLQGSIDRFKSAVSGLIQTLGESGLTGVLRGIVDIGTAVINFIERMTGAATKSVDKLQQLMGVHVDFVSGASQVVTESAPATLPEGLARGVSSASRELPASITARLDALFGADRGLAARLARQAETEQAALLRQEEQFAAETVRLIRSRLQAQEQANAQALQDQERTHAQFRAIQSRTNQLAIQEERALRQERLAEFNATIQDMARTRQAILARNPVLRFVERSQDLLRDLQTVAVDVFNQLGAALAEFARTGEFSFRRMIDSILAQTTRLSVNFLVGQLFNLAGALVGSGAGSGSGGNANLGAFNSPSRQHGGPVTAGRPFLVGERGPELFVPNADGTILPNGTTAGGVTIVNFNFPPGTDIESFRRSEGQIRSRLFAQSQQAHVRRGGR